jgi:hypothetical protein
MLARVTVLCSPTYRITLYRYLLSSFV